MKKISFALICVLSFSILSGCRKAMKVDNSLEELKGRGVFVLGLDDSFPPMGYRDDDGNIIGYDIDLAKVVAERLGVTFKAQPIDWSAKEMELSTGRIDCIWNGFTMTEEREKALSFTKPYMNNEQVLVVRKNSGIKNLGDAAGKTIGLQSCSSAQAAVDGNTDFKNSLKKIVYFKDNVIALNDLEMGGVDGVVMDSVVAAFDIALGKKPLELVPEKLSNEAYGIAFRKEDVKLRDRVQEILEDMAMDGTVESIGMKWFDRDISVIGK